jgi:polyisoprenoid-binding protein YceI
MIIYLIGLLLLVSPDAKKVSALKAESSISYSLAHPMHKTDATSKDFSCELTVNESDIQSVRFSAEVTSFDSGNSNRDSHAMEVVEGVLYPDITFMSSDIKKADGKLTVSGNLTFHGVTKPVSFESMLSSSETKTVIKGETVIKLSDHKVERPKLMLIAVSDEMKISFAMSFPVSIK